MNTKFVFQSKNIALATSKGLVKTTNEDAIGIHVFRRKTRICICDGHWGAKAAILAKSGILNTKSFPTNNFKAINLVENIQSRLFKKFGQAKMDPEKDFTPETSLLAMEINSSLELNIFSYGDCRAMITRNGKIRYKHKMHKTWLGVFSFLKLRNRSSAKKATVFKHLVCKPNDQILLFTDGVDECKYEHLTISSLWLAKQSFENSNLETIVNKIFNKIEKLGAEDNASIAIIKC